MGHVHTLSYLLSSHAPRYIGSLKFKFPITFIFHFQPLATLISWHTQHPFLPLVITSKQTVVSQSDDRRSHGKGILLTRLLFNYYAHFPFVNMKKIKCKFNNKIVSTFQLIVKFKMSLVLHKMIEFDD